MASRRPSYEILRDLIKRVTAKRFSHQTRISLSLSYKWSTDTEHLEELYGADNAQRNPIDRTEDIIRCCVTEGHTDIAVEIMDGLARQFGGAYVGGKELDALKRVAELDLTVCKVSPRDIAALRRVAESDHENGNGGISRCIECGFKYVATEWRPFSGFCDGCYGHLKAQLDKEGFVIVRRSP
jgi:hypothetical protein